MLLLFSKIENFSKTLAREAFLIGFYEESGIAAEIMSVGTLGLSLLPYPTWALDPPVTFPVALRGVSRVSGAIM